jgi:hypothetical protein
MKKYLPYLLFIAAIVISFSAELYGIIGFGEIFSGAKNHAMLLAASLGFGKLVTAAYLHEYWKSMSYSRIYLTISVVVISFMTSAGIYGFLSSAYQKTAQKDDLHNQRTNLIKTKKSRFELQLQNLEKERNVVMDNIQTLSKSLSTDNQYQTIDRKTGQVLTQIQKTSKKGVEAQLNSENQRRDLLNSRIDNVNDSVQSYELAVIEAESNNQFASELGPLKYISELTGTPTNKVVNWFLLLIIFVFDPFAIALVLAAIHSWNLKNQHIENTGIDDPDEEVTNVPGEKQNWASKFLKSYKETLEKIKKRDAEKFGGTKIEDLPGFSLDEISVADPIPDVEEVKEESGVDLIEIPKEEINQVRQPELKIKRKRGRPRNAVRQSVESIIPESENKIERTVLETDLNSDVMKHLTDSLPKKKL